jgi:hypothetical protein
MLLNASLVENGYIEGCFCPCQRKMDIYPANPPYGYHACTDGYYTSPQLVVELLGMNMVTTGTVMPSRKEMPDLLKRKKSG